MLRFAPDRLLAMKRAKLVWAAQLANTNHSDLIGFGFKEPEIAELRQRLKDDGYARHRAPGW
jgi:hypothetical protein